MQRLVRNRGKLGPRAVPAETQTAAADTHPAVGLEVARGDHLACPVSSRDERQPRARLHLARGDRQVEMASASSRDPHHGLTRRRLRIWRLLEHRRRSPLMNPRRAHAPVWRTLSIRPRQVVGVDQVLMLEMMNSVVDRDKPAVAVLLSGDGGFEDAVNRMLGKG